jgi:hypothetical protein
MCGPTAGQSPNGSIMLAWTFMDHTPYCAHDYLTCRFAENLSDLGRHAEHRAFPEANQSC